MKRIELLDYGRFIAAMMVVLFHYTARGISLGKVTDITVIPSVVEFSRYGYLGVELFFMISGYVIFYSASNRTPSQFAVSRAVRLFPTYWFAIILTSLIALRWGGDLMSVDLPQMLANFTMFQRFIGFGDVDGVYWTLVYEVLFYGAVFMLLMFGQQNNLNKIFIFWPLAMAVAYIAGFDFVPFLGGYFAYFAAGALFASLKENKNLTTMISLAIAFELCVIFSVGEAYVIGEGDIYPLSGYVVAAVITTFFAFFFAMNSKKGHALKLPGSRLLGALTYPLYLIHAHIGYMIINNFATEQNKVVVWFATLAGVLVMAYALHKIVEIKMAPFWRKVFVGSLGRMIDSLQKRMLSLPMIGKKTVN